MKIIRPFVFVALMFSLYSEEEYLFANPTGGVVSGGGATISQPNSSTVQVNQTTPKAIINWQTFNINQGETTQFVQPSSSSIILNRINANNGASIINGALNANGQVWLINPAGIMFGKSAQVNVNGLLATTSDIKDQDFLSGNYKFSPNSKFTQGAIVNEGTIRVQQSGLVALIGNAVDNRGVIQANMGKVVLGGAQAYTLDFDGDQLINFVIQQDASGKAVDAKGNDLKNTVSNSGIISVGNHLMNTRNAKNIVENSINMTGVKQANHVTVRGGSIILDAGGGKVSVSNKLYAANGKVRIHGYDVALNKANIKTSGRKSGGSVSVLADNALTIDQGVIEANSSKGGNVQLLGKTINMKDSSVKANGLYGGGEILIGGNAHGAGPQPNAQYTLVDPNTTLQANALINGDGGKVIVWADKGTGFYGSIEAKGGLLGGNGGFVETSGKEYLTVVGAKVNTLAPNGLIGMWLLDPKNITIANGGIPYADGINNTFSNLASTSLTISPDLINSSTTAVTLQANTDININDPINITNAGTTITLQAGRSIFVNNDGTTTHGSITTNNAAISLTANDPGAVSDRDAGFADITLNGPLSAGSGSISLTIGNGVPTEAGVMTLNSNITTTGALTFTYVPAVVQGTNAVNQTAGALSVGGLLTVALGTGTAHNAVLSGLNNLGSSLSITSVQDITLNDINAVALSGTIAGNLSLTANGAITQGAALTITGTSSFNAGAGVITLTNASNNLTGAVSLANTGNNTVSLTNNKALLLGTVSTTGTSAVTITTLGVGSHITQTTGSFVTGTATTTINAGTNNITLSNAANNFSTVALTGTDVTLNDVNALIMNTLNIGGNLDITSHGNLSQTAATAITASGSGNTSLNANTGSVTLRALNVGTGTLSVTGTGITQVAGTTITQAALAGDATFSAGAGVITLNTVAGNTLTGAVSLINSGNNAITLINAGPLFLSTVTKPGTAALSLTTLNAGANVTQRVGTAITTGTSTTTINAGANTINLPEANNFSTLALTGNTVTVNDSNALIISTSNIGNDFTVTTSGAITQTVATVITVTGATRLSSGNTNNITLGGSNNFSTVNIGSANAVTLVDANAINLGNISIASALVITANGNITQSSDLILPSTATFAAGIGSIDLSLNNQIASAVSLSNTGSANITVNNISSLVLGPSSWQNGTLSLTTQGSISQTGALTQVSGSTGPLNLTLNTSTSNIALSTQANNIRGIVTLTTPGNIQDFQFRNIAPTATTPVNFDMLSLRNLALIFNNVTMTIPASSVYSVTGTMQLVSLGPLTQTGPISGNALIATTQNNLGSNISLLNANNEFASVTLQTLDAAGTANAPGTIAYLDQTGFAVAGVRTSNTTANAVTLTAGGAITSTGAFSATGTTTIITNPVSNITLNFFGSNFGTVVINSGNNVTLGDSNNLDLGTSTISGTLSTSSVGLTQSGILTVAGTSTFNGGAGAITLTNSNNSFASTVSLSNSNAATVALTNNGAITLGTTSVSGALTITSNGAITQTGVITAAGVAAFDAGTTNDITLTLNNSFGSVRILSGHDASVTEAAGLVLDASTVSHDLTLATATGNGAITFSGASSIGGTLRASVPATLTGAITQSAPLTVTGRSIFVSGNSSVTLTNTSNHFMGDVTLLNASTSFDNSSHSLVNDGNLILGNIVYTNGLSISSVGASGTGGTITQATGTSIGANANSTATFTSGVGNDIILDKGNNFVTIAFPATGNVTVRDGNGLTLASSVIGSALLPANLNISVGGSGVGALAFNGASTIHQNLTVNVGSNITQTAPLTVTGSSSLTAGGAITLTNTSNLFNGGVAFTQTGASAVSLTNNGPLSIATSSLGTGSFTLTSVGATLSGPITQTGRINKATGTTTLVAGSGNNIQLNNAANDFNTVNVTSGFDVTLTDSNALILSTSTTPGISGNLNVTASTVTAGAITQSGALIVAGTSSFTNDSAAITLANSGNAFTGNITLVNTLTGSTSLRNGIALTIASASLGFGGLTLTSTGASSPITQVGPITTTGGTTTLVGGANNITLTQANDFSTVAITSGNNVSLTDINALTMGASNVTGQLNITNNGALAFNGASTFGSLVTTTSGASPITQTAAITVNGTANFSVGAAAIALTTGTNNFIGDVTITNTGANNVAITDTNALLLNNLTVGSGTLSITSVGLTQQSGTRIMQEAGAGTTTIIAGNGVLTLDSPNNDFTGSVLLTNSGANNVAITDINNLAFGPSVSGLGSGTLTIIAGGNITQTGAITQSGAGNVSITAGTSGVGGVILLNNLLGNDFVGAVSASNTTGNNPITLQDRNALTLGTISTHNSLTVQTNNNGAVTQTGILTVDGTSSFTAGGTAGGITLTNGNALTGAVTLSNTGTSSVSLTNTLPLTIASANVGAGGLTLTSTSAASPITQTGNITAGGTTTLVGGSNNITLNAANNFSTVVITSGNDVSLSDTNALTLGASSVTGQLSLTNNGALAFNGISTFGSLITTTSGASPITQTAAITVSGTANFSAGAATIALTQSNAFNGTVFLANTGSTNDVSLTNGGALLLGTSTIGRNLILSAAGSISQSGAIISGGAPTVTVTTPSSDILLNNAGNQFAQAPTFTNNGNIRDLSYLNSANGVGVAFSTLAIGRNLNITTQNGAITQAGGSALSVAGTTTLITGTAAITLANPLNSFTGSVSLINSNTAAITTNGALHLGLIDPTDLTLTAGGDISQDPGTSIVATGTTTVNANGFNVSLNNTGNDFNIFRVNNGGVVNVRDDNAINLGLSNTSGSFTITAASGAISQSGAITAPSVIASSVNGLSLNASNLISSFTGTNTTGGDIILTNSTPLTITGITQTGGGNLTVTNTGALTSTGSLSTDGGSISLTADLAISLNGAITAGGLNVTSTSAAITQTGSNAIVATGATTLSAGTDISLTSSNNDFNTLAITNGQNANITDTNALTFNASTVTGQLSIINNGALAFNGASTLGSLVTTIPTSGASPISQTAPLTVNGTASFNAGAATITLNQTNNFNGAVSLTNSGTNDVNLTNGGALLLGASTIGRNLTLSAAGSISQSGALLVTGGATTVTVTSPSSDILLNNAGNQFAQGPTFTNNGNIRDLSFLNTVSGIGITFPTLTIGRNLSITTTNGAITQQGGNNALVVSGTTTLIAGNAAITLANSISNVPLNSFVGAVSFSNTLNSSVNLRNNTNFIIATSSAGAGALGNLTLNAAGSITQTGTITVGGATVLTATGGNDINLPLNTNNFGAVNLNARNVIIHDVNTIGFSGTVTGTMDAVAAGQINQSGALSVTGVSSFTATSGILLSNVLNNFQQAVSLTNTTSNQINLVNNAPVILGTVNSGALPLTVTAAGSITQTGIITASGTSTFTVTVPSSDILLAQANQFTQTPTFTNNGNIRNLTYVNAANGIGIAFPLLAITGNLNISTNNGAITQSAALSVNGTSNFSAGSALINLANASNAFAGAVSLNNTGIGNNASVVDTGTLSIGASTIGGSGSFTTTGAITQVGNISTGVGLTLAANGAISQSGGAVITAPGTTTLNAGGIGVGNTISLTNNNNFGTVSIVQSNNASLTDINALSLGASTVSGTFTVNAGGAITQSGTVTAPTVLVTAVGGVTLSASNSISSFNASNTSSGDIALVNGVPLTLTGISQAGGGDLTVTNTGSLSTAGLIATDGGDVNLSTNLLSGNTSVLTIGLGGNVTTNGGAISLTAANANGTDFAVVVNDSLNTTGGVGPQGTLTVSGGVILNGSPIVGPGNITLQGNGFDLTLGTLNLNSPAAFVVNRFLVVNGIVTNDPGLSLNLVGDANNTGVGGVLIASTGGINANGDFTVSGSSLNGLSLPGVDPNAAIQLQGGGTLTSSGTITLTGNIGANNIVLDGAITSANLNVTSNGAITQGGLNAIAISNTSTLSANNDISLTSSNNDFNALTITGAQNASIRDTNALSLGASTVTGQLSLVNSGGLDFSDSSTLGSLISTTFGANPISQSSGILTVATTASFNAGAAAITLNQQNAFNGAVSLTNSGANDVSLTNAEPLLLGTSTIGRNLTLSANGSISQNGIITTGGASTFTVNASNSDILLGLNNQFAQGPTFTNNTNIHDLTYVNAASGVGFAFSDLAISGNLNISTNAGAITQTGILTVTGTTNLATGNAAITLNNASNSFTGAVSVNTSGVNNNATVADTGTLSIGASTIGGNGSFSTTGAITQVGNISTSRGLNLTANGAIDQLGSAVITALGTTTLDAGGTGVGNTISLTNDNNFGTARITQSNNTSLRDIDALILDTSAVTGNFTVNTGGAITQSGGSTLTITGNTILAAGASNDITLNMPGNNFNNVAVVSGKAVTLNDTNAIILGTSTISGSYSVSAGGNISQNGIITTASASTFTATAASSDITLNQANQFGQAPTFLNNGNIRDINYRNSLAGSSVPGIPTGTRNLTLQFDAANTPMDLPFITLSNGGSLSATTNNSAVTQQAALTIPGTTTINAGAAPINLSDSNNQFLGAVYLNTSNSATLTTNSALLIGSIDPTDLSLTAHGMISQLGKIIASGNTIINSNGNVIDLTNSNNDFNTINILNGTNVALTDTNALTLGASNISNQLAVTTGGTFTQSSGISVPTLNLNTTGGALLNTFSNSIQNFSATNLNGAIQLSNTAATLTVNGITQLSGGNVELTNTGELTIASAISTQGGDVSLYTLYQGGGNPSRLIFNANVSTQGGSITGLADNYSDLTNILIVNSTLDSTGGVGQGRLIVGYGVVLNTPVILGSGNITLQTPRPSPPDPQPPIPPSPSPDNTRNDVMQLSSILDSIFAYPYTQNNAANGEDGLDNKETARGYCLINSNEWSYGCDLEAKKVLPANKTFSLPIVSPLIIYTGGKKYTFTDKVSFVEEKNRGFSAKQPPVLKLNNNPLRQNKSFKLDSDLKMPSI